MHYLRVLHVDLKAENILLTRGSSSTAPVHHREGQLTAKVRSFVYVCVCACV
jgi:serine/threonine protein kinase